MEKSDEITTLLYGLHRGFREWEMYKKSIEQETELDDPNHPNTDHWNKQLSLVAEWRDSLEKQLIPLRRMVAPYAADTQNAEKWSLQDMFRIMGEKHE